MMEKDFILTPTFFKTLRRMKYVLNAEPTGEEGEILYDCIGELFDELKEETECNYGFIDEVLVINRDKIMSGGFRVLDVMNRPVKPQKVAKTWSDIDYDNAFWMLDESGKLFIVTTNKKGEYDMKALYTDYKVEYL